MHRGSVRNDPDITWLCANEGLIVGENLVSVGRRSVSERIAMLLIHLYKRAERIGLVEADGLRLPLNQQHIADALGLSLVHTNKTLKRLQAAGLYTLKDGCLRLVNPAAMARMADYYLLCVAVALSSADLTSERKPLDLSMMGRFMVQSP